MKDMNNQLSPNSLEIVKKLNSDELHTLSHIVMERLRLIENSKTLSALRKFQFFDCVYFIRKGKKYEGVITRLNKMTATIK